MTAESEARDTLFPRGDRPTCSRCRQRPAYMAGLCGRCMTDDAVAATTTPHVAGTRVAAALAALADPDLADIEAFHLFEGPAHSSDDGLGRCSCGDPECETSVVLGILERVRAALRGG